MNNEISKLVVVGINHRTSMLSEREKFQINKKKIPEALNYLVGTGEVEGAVIVSTCNRLEFYMVLKPDADPFSIIYNFYFEKEIKDGSINKKLFYVYTGIDAVKHLFGVTAGLDSLLLGEYQIQGQVKDAYSVACSHNTADKIIHKLFHSAFRAGKAVRTETRIGSYNQSVSNVAFRIIKDKLKKEDVVTIVGVNQNTKIISEKLNRAGFTHLLFVNRKLYKAEELAERYNGLAFSLDYIEEPMISSKCVLSCTGAPGYIITSDQVNKIYSRNRHPRLLIDMAVPRDINTEGLIKDIEVIDMDGLKKYLGKENEEIMLNLPKAERIISDEANIFNVWNESLADESMSCLQEKIEEVRLQLLDEKKPQVSGSEFELLNKFSRSLVHRMKTIITQAIKTTPADAHQINKRAF